MLRDLRQRFTKTPREWARVRALYPKAARRKRAATLALAAGLALSACVDFSLFNFCDGGICCEDDAHSCEAAPRDGEVDTMSSEAGLIDSAGMPGDAGMDADAAQDASADADADAEVDADTGIRPDAAQDAGGDADAAQDAGGDADAAPGADAAQDANARACILLPSAPCTIITLDAGAFGRAP
jgi:hypothetical protein